MTTTITTQITGDIVNNIAVISALNVDDLALGQHQFWFKVATNALNQDQLLPVWVFKGQRAGKKVMITAGIHGDELNGILTAQQLARQLKDTEVCGCITIIPAINLSGIIHHHRDFHSADQDLSSINLNRYFPGNSTGNAAERYLAQLWQQLLLPNADIAVDLHTQTTGTCYPLYVFADFRVESALAMARLMTPDAILNDPGDLGVLETVWNAHGVSAITVEVGSGKITQPELIDRAVTGVMKIITNQQQLATMTIEACAIEANTVTSIRADIGGLTLAHVEMLAAVNEGDVIATQYDLFGNEIKCYTAPSAGIVLSHNTDALREAGALVVRLIHN
ncbi:deacylase [Photobacterium kishitanii]|nr:succinylglutamate desuccinylase/aspartoacylase family protein [Photobacterium kishitanii]PSU97763.1 deacylase [Photobacterium kishitanii]